MPNATMPEVKSAVQDLPLELKPPEVMHVPPEVAQQAQPSWTPATAAPPAAVAEIPSILNPMAAPFQAGSSPMDMMAVLRQRALEQVRMTADIVMGEFGVGVPFAQ